MTFQAGQFQPRQRDERGGNRAPGKPPARSGNVRGNVHCTPGNSWRDDSIGNRAPAPGPGRRKRGRGPRPR
ncbi:MAG: hypothetical protein F9K31_13315 [Dokdonella sp.]|nr:MAG: hypothetical protein F9K31_13315 [Dokdonella sp.]